MKKKCCALVSGGIDSCYMITKLSEEYEVIPCYMDYNQKVRDKELSNLSAFLSDIKNDNLKVFSLYMKDVFEDFWAVKGDKIPEYTGPISNEYIPARNILFITKLAAYMQLNDIDYVALGSTATDCMPDNNRKFFNKLEEVLELGMDRKINILTPIVHMEKSEIVKEFVLAGYNVNHTWSCYDYKKKHCGECWQCYERYEAFVKSGLDDETLYETPVKLR